MTPTTEFPIISKRIDNSVTEATESLDDSGEVNEEENGDIQSNVLEVKSTVVQFDQGFDEIRQDENRRQMDGESVTQAEVKTSIPNSEMEVSANDNADEHCDENNLDDAKLNDQAEKRDEVEIFHELAETIHDNEVNVHDSVEKLHDEAEKLYDNDEAEKFHDPVEKFHDEAEKLYDNDEVEKFHDPAGSHDSDQVEKLHDNDQAENIHDNDQTENLHANDHAQISGNNDEEDKLDDNESFSDFVSFVNDSTIGICPDSDIISEVNEFHSPDHDPHKTFTLHPIETGQTEDDLIPDEEFTEFENPVHIPDRTHPLDTCSQTDVHDFGEGNSAVLLLCLNDEIRKSSVWSQLCRLETTCALNYRWTSSFSNSNLLAALKIDSRNILAGPWSKLLVRGFPCDEHKAKDMKSDSMKMMDLSFTKESVPHPYFDWVGSGLINPLDVSFPDGPRCKPHSTQLHACEKNTFLQSLPDLSFMRQNFIIFPKQAQ